MKDFQAEDQILFEAIEAYRNGNGDKATIIYEGTKKYTFNILHKEVERFKSQGVLTGDAISITEDVMQELYLDFFKKIANFRNEDPKSIFKWISIVSHRMLLDYVDRNKMEVLQFEKDEDYREENDLWDSSEINDSDMEGNHELLPEAALEDKEFRELIIGFVQSLPEAQAQTVLLHFRGGMKYQEIADEMGVSLITVKTRMKKAKDSLEEIINKYEKKTGTKLHSVSILPLLWLLYRMASENTTVPATVDAAVTSSIAGASSVAGASGVGIGGATTVGSVVTKAISTRVLVAIVSTAVVIGGVAVGSQVIGKKQETSIEQSDSVGKEEDNPNDNKQDNESATPSKEDKDTTNTNGEPTDSTTNQQNQDGGNNGDTTNVDNNTTQGGNGAGNNTSVNATGNGNSSGSAGTGGSGDSSDNDSTGGSESNTGSGNDSGNEDTSESTVAKGTKENPYRIGEKITITDGIVYNPSLYDSQEVYQFEITVTDYIPLEEALAKKGVEFSSGIVLRTVEATVKFTGGITEGLPYEHTPIDLKLLKENGFSHSWSGFMYGADNSNLYAIQNDVEYDIGLNPSYDTQDVVWSYLGIDYYTSDGQWNRLYVKLE